MLPSWFRDIERRVNNMIARAIVTKTNEGKHSQTCNLTVMTGEYLSNVDRLQQFGFSSFAPDNSEATVAFVTGSREFPLILAVDQPEKRFKVKQGEAAIYSAYETYWHLKADKSLNGKAAKLNLELTEDAKIKSPKTQIESDKFAVKSSGDELIKVLSDLCGVLVGMQGKLISAKPGDPVVAATLIAEITPIKQRLDQFIG